VVPSFSGRRKSGAFLSNERERLVGGEVNSNCRYRFVNSPTTASG
jgi:hypothetical protein